MVKITGASFMVVALFLAGITLAISHTVMDDSIITSKIKEKIAEDKLVSDTDLKIETNKGVVAIVGLVKDITEAERVIEIVYSVPGVMDIDTAHFKVQVSEQPLSDAIITAKVKGVFAREKIFGSSPISVTKIHVNTTDGTVYLTGKVLDKKQEQNAIRLVKDIKGVKEVKSAMEYDKK